MVEGPGCKINGEKLKPRIKGQRIAQIDRPSVSEDAKSSVKGSRGDVKVPDTAPSRGKSLHPLVGQTVSDVQTLGKELFIFFSDFDKCLRIHFLMNGSLRFHKDSEQPQKLRGPPPTLTVTMTTDKVMIFESSSDIMDATRCLQKIERLQALDICFERFSHKKAVEVFSRHGSRLVCDVLLDQAVLPGVGNIIKNEALFDSGIKPDTKVEQLTSSQISHLIKMTRDFTMIFYKCRKTNKPLSAHLKIYEKQTCRQCNSKVVKTRMGEDSGRWTMFCPCCQNNSHTGNLPSKNSLLSWASSKSWPSTCDKSSDWSCHICTLLNKASRSTCEVCSTPRFETPAPTVDKSHFGGGMPAAFPPNIASKRTSDFGVGNSSSLEFAAPPLKKRRVSDQSDILKSQHDPPNKIKTEGGMLPDAPTCAKHKTSCKMRRVHKAGANHSRMFWSCPQHGCNFFQWADEGFPLCEGHGKRTVLRTVLKQGANNGRSFFACSLNKDKQCSFFQWT